MLSLTKLFLAFFAFQSVFCMETVPTTSAAYFDSVMSAVTSAPLPSTLLNLEVTQHLKPAEKLKLILHLISLDAPEALQVMLLDPAHLNRPTAIFFYLRTAITEGASDEVFKSLAYTLSSAEEYQEYYLEHVIESALTSPNHLYLSTLIQHPQFKAVCGRRADKIITGAGGTAQLLHFYEKTSKEVFILLLNTSILLPQSDILVAFAQVYWAYDAAIFNGLILALIMGCNVDLNMVRRGETIFDLDPTGIFTRAARARLDVVKEADVVPDLDTYFKIVELFEARANE